MAANVQIDIQATDKATGVINGVNKSLGGMAGGLNNTIKTLTGFSLGNLTAAGAVWKVGKFLADTTNETQKYNLAMVDMARKMGTTTEEASRLTQVGDDVRLSQEQISTAMNFAVRNGIQPNIEGLAKLADQYNSLEDPVARGQLLLKTFGRAGMDMGKLLEKGGDGIRKMSAGIEDSLIVTEKAARESQLYFQSVDRLTDAWTGFKMQIGNTVIPVLTDILIKNQAAKMTTDELGTAASRSGTGFSAEYKALLKVNEVLLRYGELSGWDLKETGFLANAMKNSTKDIKNFDDWQNRIHTSLANTASAARYTGQAILALGEDAVESRDEVKGLNQQIDKLKSRDIWITTYLQTVNLGSGVSNAMNTYGQSLTEQYWKWRLSAAGEAAQGGGGTTTPVKRKKKGASGFNSYTVPEGYYGDSFPVMAQTGEQVTVKPRGTEKNNNFDYDRLERTLTRVFRNAALKS
jgi:hypothetical protein